jgi:hypothetical protein
MQGNAISAAEDNDRTYSHIAAGSNDADSDFTTIRD